MKKVIIIGGHVQSLGITRILGKLDYKITIIDSTKYNLARHSRFCYNFIKFKNEKLLEKLLEIGQMKQYQNSFVFPTNDYHVEVLSKNKELLSKHFIVASDNWSSVEKCYNKRLTYQIAKDLNIPIAKTWMPNSLEELLNLEIEYPVIIKPAVMHSFYSKLKKKVFVCNNKNDLITNYNLSLSVIPSNEIIIQSIINGGSQHLYSACFLFDRGKEVQSFVGRRARQHPPDFGNATTFAQIVDNNELLNISRNLLKEIRYRGMCEVEFKFDKESKEFKLLEINPRTWKWHSIADKSKINLLENYILLLQGKQTKINTKITKASFRHLLTDIPTLFRYKKLGIYKKYKSYPIQYAVWSKSDLKPALFELIYLPYFLLKR
tara:strand:+ start:704 stop:1834 length:1131 start_codon:yes stop_codon:yes gene_type:complete